MKKKLYIFIILSFLISCDDGFLDRTPYTMLSGNVIWTSDENALMAINGIYNNSLLESGDVYWGGTLGSYSCIFTWFGPDGYNFFRSSTIEMNTATTRDLNFMNWYMNMYRIIQSANVAIANLIDNQYITPALAARMTGEAKFFRGISYFYLWQLYGGVIILDKPVLASETYLPRNTAKEVKEFIIKDLTDAIELLPVNYPSSDYGRITKGAAIAQLGKAYLYDQQWDKAAEQFRKLMTTPYTYDLHPEYWQLFDYKWEKNSEVVYSIQAVDQPGLGNRNEQWRGSRATFKYAHSWCQPSHLAFETYTYADGTPFDLASRPKRGNYDTEFNYGVDLMAWYENALKSKPVDKRLQGNIIMPTDTFIGLNSNVYKVYWPYAEYANASPPALRSEFSGYAIYHFRKFVNTSNENATTWNSPNDIPMIRFADVLLMYAEALNEQSGPTSEVYNAINRVRTRAGVDNLPEGLNKENMRRYIRLERYHEFIGEGHLFFDVKRWRTAHTDDPVFGLNHNVLDFRGEVLFTRKFAEKYYLWPIPEAERDINKNLDQNPGWEQ